MFVLISINYTWYIIFNGLLISLRNVVTVFRIKSYDRAPRSERSEQAAVIYWIS